MQCFTTALYFTPRKHIRLIKRGLKEMGDIINVLLRELGIKEWQAQNVIKLIDEGNTIPFIARYRKEVTGEMDDTVLRNFSERLIYLRNLDQRKNEVKRLIEEQGKLTEELTVKIETASTITEIDDIYRPFRPKKRTRATIAKEKGLDPLGKLMYEQVFNEDLKALATKFINDELGVSTIEEALKGAMDIIAEDISDNADFRKEIRRLTFLEGAITTKGDADKSTPFEMYYDYKEAINRIVPHRILAINRGRRKKYLTSSLRFQ